MPKQVKTLAASASRTTIRMCESISSWVLLHELAHSMTCLHDGRSALHGPVYVGVYVKLLVRYLRLDRDALLASLRSAGIAVDPDAEPVFLDPGQSIAA